MNQETYELGKQHYWEGLDVSAMDSAEPSARVAWLCGYLDAMGEHRMLTRSQANRNRSRVLPKHWPAPVRPLPRLAIDQETD